MKTNLNWRARSERQTNCKSLTTCHSTGKGRFALTPLQVPRVPAAVLRLLVVGFNARPLARSARQAGFRVLAVDYWGDLDLAQWTDQYFAILRQQPGHRPERPLLPAAKALVEGARHILGQHGPVQYILVSGGLDDYPEAWDTLAGLAPLAGNTSDVIRRARNRGYVADLALRAGGAVPSGSQVASGAALRRAVNRLSLPVVVKPSRGSGGFFTRVLRTDADVSRYATHHRFESTEPLLVQDLIVGKDASVSVLGTGERALAVSVNEQLIGLRRLGRGRTKAYCGNVVPLQARPEIRARLAHVAEEMAVRLGLVGSNGFDFVVTRDGTPYFMEVNPRFQATIEAFELTTEANLVRLHLDACDGRLPEASPRSLSSCSRVIVYARQPCTVPNLHSFPNVVDLSLPGSLADRGDPICTVNSVGRTRVDTLKGAWQTADAIYRLLQRRTAPDMRNRNSF
jgi:predicted ATP-grasp superfamily ATP-dependent carboligase